MKRMIQISTMLAFAVILFGCAGTFRNYGTVKTDRETALMFEQKQLPADYRYYYVGADSEPNAIIGIAPGYTLKTRLWKAVDLTDATLSGWLRSMTGGLGTGTGIWGAALLAKDGRRVGVWYSPHEPSTIIVTPEGEVTVNPPRPNILDNGLSPFSPINRELYAPEFPRTPNR